MIASSCELQPCRKSNAQYKRVFGLLQPIPGDSVKWRHFRSPKVMWCHFLSRDRLLLRATGLVRSQTPSILEFLAFYSHFQVTSGSLPVTRGHSRHFLSRDCLLLRASLVEVKRTVYASFWPSTATSRWLPVKWRHFPVTSGHQRWRDIICCDVTASSCELPPSKKSNAHCTWVVGLLQPLPGNFSLNDVNCGSLPVTRGHVMSFPATWLPPPAS